MIQMEARQGFNHLAFRYHIIAYSTIIEVFSIWIKLHVWETIYNHRYLFFWVHWFLILVFTRFILDILILVILIIFFLVIAFIITLFIFIFLTIWFIIILIIVTWGIILTSISVRPNVYVPSIDILRKIILVLNEVLNIYLLNIIDT